MTIAYSPPPIIESGAVDYAIDATTAPALLWLGQASGIVVATLRPPDLSAAPIASYALFRAPTASGPWTQVDVRAPSPFCRWVNLFDPTPLYDERAYYYAATDSGEYSKTLYFVANSNTPAISAAGTLSAGALGSYPLLGSDVFLNAMTGEAVIGPGGDLLAVNGLELLAQDLRTRITTQQGELLLHPQFGLSRQRLIGSGQSNPAAQAQVLQAQFIDAYTADPRVLAVQSLTISKVSWSAWMVDVVLVAIGIEDPQRLNVVIPFYQQ